MLQFLGKYELAFWIAELLVLAIGAPFLWFGVLRKGREEGDLAGTETQPPPQESERCRIILSPTRQFIGSIVAPLVILLLWISIGPLWTILIVAIIAAAIIALAGKWKVAIGILVLALICVAGIGAWMLTHKQPPAVATTTPTGAGAAKSNPGNGGNAAPNTAAAGTATAQVLDAKNCDPYAIPGERVTKVINGNEQPIAPARPCGDQSSGNQPSAGQSAPPAGKARPIATTPPIEYRPFKVSGRGDVEFRSLGGCDLPPDAGEVFCTMYVMNQTSAPMRLWLEHVEGTDDQGLKFKSVATNRVTNTLAFVGDGYEELLQPGVKTQFVFTFEEASAINEVGGFTLWYSFDGGLNKWPVTFSQIPVAH